MESTRVLGVGLGVFFISLFWFVALLLSLMLYRVRAVWPLIFTCLAALLTAILPALPRESINCNEPDCSSNVLTTATAFKVF